jgi:phospholipid/cholesterol/gamma-HCH transport system substrate-binding protein
MSAEPGGSSSRERYLFLGSGLVLALALAFGLAREQAWGTRFVPLRLRSTDAEGLRAGQEVRISGMPVGQVRALELLPDARVEVQLRVQERYVSLIGPRSVASLGQEGLIGDQFLVISPDPQPGAPPGALKERRLTYQQPTTIRTLIQRLDTTQAELQRTLRHTSRLTAQDLPLTLGEMRRGLGGVRQLTTSLKKESETTGPHLRRGLAGLGKLSTTLDRETSATGPQLRQGLRGVQQLTTTLDRETNATGPQLRQTLQQLSRGGDSVERTALEAQQLLRQSQPPLLGSLRELETLTKSLNRILKGLMGLAGSEETSPPAPKP